MNTHSIHPHSAESVTAFLIALLILLLVFSIASLGRNFYLSNRGQGTEWMRIVAPLQ